ncbi:MAG: alpha-1,4-glucan--maltose-1-phosphate maltosyltransferase [Betaproteobacteria bacterium]|nr:alpha-1,4-glucan--maltose-1-phosphate maltosyltransferase [Betaproteobacteria bacterium]
MLADDGRRRVVIESVSPAVDGGRFPIKRVVGDRVIVEADVFADGHDALRCMLRYHQQGARSWEETEMALINNDRWRGAFEVAELGRYEYTVAAWVDGFLSWRHDFVKREDPADIVLALQVGAMLVEAAASRAKGAEARALRGFVKELSADSAVEERRRLAAGDELLGLMMRYPDRSFSASYPLELEVVVDRPLARCSAWYEMFPRSCAGEAGRHGTFADCEKRLDYVAQMGFDILYLPPVHPIGRVKRKGRNNALEPGPNDPGSPWAIGAKEGGHKAVHPALGSLADFRKLVAAAQARGLEVALDLAFQCAPDHPYVDAHSEWFRRRPDGSIQFAENPPKKYQDIYPFHFESEHWAALWEELKSVFAFWVEQGVTIFRVDNPHTKPFSFWEWLIADMKREHPELIFLSEAFTRPRIMHRLAKLGFTQSYTYFPWRNTKGDLTEYFTELSQSRSREYFRPNHWPNTPDILTAFLQSGGRPAFMARVVLAATLGANYGIYGPAFEHCENLPREPGSEEYLNSEKYEVRHWDLARADSLAPLITRLNRARHENPALQQDWNLIFVPTDNHELVCYGKFNDERSNIIVVAVSLDPHHTRSAFVELPLEEFGIDAGRPYQVEDLLNGESYLWQGPRNYVELDPRVCPAHVFRVRQQLRSEKDFEYFA